MTRGPQVIGPEKLAAEAVEIMDRNKISQLLVVDQDRRLLGALNMHDLFRAKVI
jgi:arabinose-5-phosphate isomerase